MTRGKRAARFVSDVVSGVASSLFAAGCMVMGVLLAGPTHIQISVGLAFGLFAGWMALGLIAVALRVLTQERQR